MFRVMMFMDGAEVPSSCVHTGTQRQCEGAASRLNRQRDKSPRVEWRVLPCVQ